ncbi:hypothetical protein GCM10020358_35960 [Amorphoplanes nipponensis]|uniref:IrrE N-terminal-like domain-containing protein n=1 Tax=Actinoplanes nipponensis TaxID=135950 RepID=A0A919JGG7_9ACTN|nr:ImmA/IrrE family metallo-endopeptidase [Actinoplanes nipponensis]GIE48955.1 hypothetical protein Ani05nite_24890 [Actinoplanes nipponensis]
MPDGALPRDAVHAYVDSLAAPERARVGEDVLAGIRAGGYLLTNPFEAVDAGIRRTLAVSGVDVPGGTHVGAFPHRSLHARTHTVEGATLILLDTGLRPLLDRVAATLVAYQLTTAPGQRRAGPNPPPAADRRQRRDEADAAFAAAVLAFLRGEAGEPAETLDTFGFFMARSAERFALGHEYGHLLAGHRHAPPGHDERSARREYEADELAAMLILRGVDDAAEFRWRALAVAGPFLFLAVEQLVNQVRGTADEQHVSPARRTQALRTIFEQAGARGLMHFAEAWVSSLLLREAAIVRRARA